MRIISGSFKGKKILEPKDKQTRPLKDLAKESIFNVITHSNKFKIDFNNSIILDLFSGVGSFGLECLSRGVDKVFFIENYIGVLPILEKNLSNLKTVNNYKIIKKNIYKDDIFNNFENKFDIIFLDPPYKDKNINIIFEKIAEFKILKKNSIIILHRHKKEGDIFPKNFEIIEEKEYGISKIIFLANSS
jgi:16S rRNA (guanine966-N2)-methyltransferase